jgi:hypothetical protein
MQPSPLIQLIILLYSVIHLCLLSLNPSWARSGLQEG